MYIPLLTFALLSFPVYMHLCRENMHLLQHYSKLLPAAVVLSLLVTLLRAQTSGKHKCMIVER